MTHGTAQRADAVRNRRAILDAAGRLLLEHGDLSMTDLARTAGVTRPTLYRHFPDREHVLDALARDLGPLVVARLLETFEGLPLADALDRLAADVVDVARQHRELLDAGHRQLHELARLIVPGEPIARLLEERRTSGELRPTHDVDWLARCIRALCLTAIDDTRDAEVVRADLARSLRAVTS
ncbi:TetR/AcrR family transcriptional regulator [Aeromicrobium sp. CnD17-E]|uniref:TetR/AcrR family transcriptional regulator n=1 Tax=Aeromicrobium sp. CnD17-E TaxID=2954487 RepID=UPI002098402A|nr:TetR/AcrR family transcriptional regulator [Aeromicrobium sp. CnD17-E]MCO7239343.1 TetR/AcrR family transcriptional regulator [Aeromicrobium sp. CnD17-E]